MKHPDCGTGAIQAGFVFSGTADAPTVAQCRHELSQWLRANFVLDAVRLNDVLLAVNEALTNSAEFAYVGSLRHGTMTMRARYHAADGLSIEVSDHGTWRQPDPSTQSNTRGRGIPLMRALADRMTISRQPTGTRVQLEFDDCSLLTEESYATTA